MLVYLILIPLLLFIIWLIIKRKWKSLFWTLGITVIVGISTWFIFLYIVSSIFKENCEIVQTWEIEGYVIKQMACKDFVTGFYHPVKLYKDDQFIDSLPVLYDNVCNLTFQSKEESLTFDICENQMK